MSQGKLPETMKRSFSAPRRDPATSLAARNTCKRLKINFLRRLARVASHPRSHPPLSWIAAPRTRNDSRIRLAYRLHICNAGVTYIAPGGLRLCWPRGSVKKFGLSQALAKRSLVLKDFGNARLTVPAFFHSFRTPPGNCCGWNHNRKVILDSVENGSS